jgi:CRP-like cAMP-binding protein
MYGDREIIVRQGDIGVCMFAVQAGRLEVVRETEMGNVRLGVLHEGDIFGEMAIVEREPRSATVRALGDVRLLTVDKRTFLSRVHEDPSIALNLAKSLCGRVRRLNAELAKMKQALAVRSSNCSNTRQAPSEA